MSRTGPREEQGTRRKLVLTLVVGLAAAAVATQGTGATFTASASRGHSITTGTPSLVLGATGAVTNRLGIDVTALAPGGSAYRAFDITNQGNYAFSSYVLNDTVTSSSKLDTDVSNGLQVTLERCSSPWTENGVQPVFSYTCSGTRTTVLSSRPVAQSNQPLPGLSSWSPGGTDHLLLTETLPSSADNTFQNLTSAITYVFDGA